LGTARCTWNAYNRLTALSYPGGTESYGYNGVDSRISRTAGGVATSFKRAGAGQTSPVLSEIQGGSTSVRYLPGVYEDRSGTVTNYHSGIKNTFLQTNSAGSQTASKRYDAFGNVLASSGTWQGRFAYGGPHGYQTDASLQLLGDRYYDPSLGRFLTRDVAKDGRNWYVYCDGNPVKFADRGGRIPALIALALDPEGAYWSEHQPKHPPGEGVFKNIKKLDEAFESVAFSWTPNSWENGSIYQLNWWKLHVSTGGGWDYHSKLGSDYDAFGNFNYGATGRHIGLPKKLLLRFGGWTVTTKKEGFWAGLKIALLGEPPYGDSTEDQKWIARGAEYHDRKCPEHGL
jgi:RHS repeat-associated protein